MSKTQYAFDPLYIIRSPALPSLGPDQDVLLARQIIARIAGMPDVEAHAAQQSDTSHVVLMANNILLAHPVLYHAIAQAGANAASFQGTVENYVRRAVQRATPRAAFAGNTIVDGGDAASGDALCAHLSGAKFKALMQAIESHLMRTGDLILAQRHGILLSQDTLLITAPPSSIGKPSRVRRRSVTPLEHAILSAVQPEMTLTTLRQHLASHWDDTEIHSSTQALFAEGTIVPAAALTPNDIDPCAWLLGPLRAHYETALPEPLWAGIAQLSDLINHVTSPYDPELPDHIEAVNAQIDALKVLLGADTPNAVSITDTQPLRTSEHETSPVSADMIRQGFGEAVHPAAWRAMQRCVDRSLRTFPGRVETATAFHKLLYHRFGEAVVSLHRACEVELEDSVSSGGQDGATGELRRRIDRMQCRAPGPLRAIDLTEYCHDHAYPAQHDLRGGVALFRARHGARDVGPGEPWAQLMGLRPGSGACFMGRFAGQSATLDAHLTAVVGRYTAQSDAAPVELLFGGDLAARDILVRGKAMAHYLLIDGSGHPNDPNSVTPSDLGVLITEHGLSLVHFGWNRPVQLILNTVHDWQAPGQPTLYKLLGAIAQPGGLAIPEISLTDRNHQAEIRIEGCVVRGERWLITHAERHDLTRLSRPQRLAWVQEWQTRRGVTRFVSCLRGDQRWTFDLARAADAARLAHALQNHGTIVERWYPALGQLTNQQSGAVHEGCETLVNFHAQTEAPAPQRAIDRMPLDPRPIRPLGPVFFAKIYGPHQRTTEALMDVLAPVCERFAARATSDRWFFMRYADPQPHLRLRLILEDVQVAADARHILSSLLDRLVQAGQIDRWALDAYQPETLRYGGTDAIEIAEHLFMDDARATLAISRALISENCHADTPLMAACALRLCLLHSALGLDAQASAQVCTNVQTAFRRNGVSDLPKNDPAITEVFAQARAYLDTEVLDEAIITGHQAACEAGARLRALDRQNHLTRPLRTIAVSLTHMMANRQLTGWSRRKEHVIYAVATRLIRSKDARLAALDAAAQVQQAAPDAALVRV